MSKQNRLIGILATGFQTGNDLADLRVKRNRFWFHRSYEEYTDPFAWKETVKMSDCDGDRLPDDAIPAIKAVMGDLVVRYVDQLLRT